MARPMAQTGFTRNSNLIHAPAETLYRAFLDPEALLVWLPPGEMTGKIHSFDAQVGGGYRMSLFYPDSEPVPRGKTTEQEDQVSVRFVELTPPVRIVQAVNFNSSDPALAGEMKMTITFGRRGSATEVTIVCEDIPPGIRPEDNETGTRMSLEQLARYSGSVAKR